MGTQGVGVIRKTRWDGEGFNRYIYLESLWGYPAKWLKLDEDEIKQQIEIAIYLSAESIYKHDDCNGLLRKVRKGTGWKYLPEEGNPNGRLTYVST